MRAISSLNVEIVKNIPLSTNHHLSDWDRPDFINFNLVAYYTYILISPKNRYYIGYTSDIALRLKSHNSNKSEYTKDKGPWKLFYFEEFDTETSAIHRERQIKNWKSRRAIERLKLK